MQAYLPDPYHECEADSVTILLFFRRIASKIDLLINLISQIHGLPSALHTASSELLVGVCELRGKLRHFSTLNKRFAAVISRSSPEEWLAINKVRSEVAGIENKVDGWIACIKADDFNEGDCARELANLIAQFDHLAETSFGRPELDIPERQLGSAHSLDDDLDNFAVALGFAKQAVLGLAEEDDIETVEGASSFQEGIYEPVQRILDLVRGVKTASSKLVTHVGELVQSSTALLPDANTALVDLVTSISNAVDLAVQLAQRIGAHVTSIRASKQPLILSDIEQFLVEVTAELSDSLNARPWDLIEMFISKLGNELSIAMSKIKQAVKAGQVVSSESGSYNADDGSTNGLVNLPPPWIARVTSMKEAAVFNVDTERKVVRLSEELNGMLREVKLRVSVSRFVGLN